MAQLGCYGSGDVFRWVKSDLGRFYPRNAKSNEEFDSVRKQLPRHCDEDLEHIGEIQHSDT